MGESYLQFVRDEAGEAFSHHAEGRRGEGREWVAGGEGRERGRDGLQEREGREGESGERKGGSRMND